jgi:hypothetical protein
MQEKSMFFVERLESSLFCRQLGNCVADSVRVEPATLGLCGAASASPAEVSRDNFGKIACLDAIFKGFALANGDEGNLATVTAEKDQNEVLGEGFTSLGKLVDGACI